jgi:hypothetical protein
MFRIKNDPTRIHGAVAVVPLLLVATALPRFESCRNGSARKIFSTWLTKGRRRARSLIDYLLIHVPAWLQEHGI